jgi:hypothetical protein
MTDRENLVLAEAEEKVFLVEEEDADDKPLFVDEEEDDEEDDEADDETEDEEDDDEEEDDEEDAPETE